jgi:type IV pilus assembly protein PilQ
MTTSRPTRTASAGLLAATLLALPFGPAARAADQAGVQPAGKEMFNVEFADTDVVQALQMLAAQGRRNIVASKDVIGTITATLYDVTVLEALETVVRANDLRYEEVGNFIYVYSSPEWNAIQQARRKRESRRFTLEYLAAKDAVEFVTPLLSENGKVSFVGQVEKGYQPDLTMGGEDSWAHQGMLVINDFPENLETVSTLLAEIDTAPRQVSVESTIVATDVNEDDAYGIDFSVLGSVDFSDFTNPGQVVNNLIQGNNTPGAKADGDKGFQPADNQAYGLSSNVGQVERAGGMKVGVISENVSFFPRVMALNRQRAEVLIGERVGYLSTTTTETTSTQTVQYLDTGIKLVFRPFISKDDSIRMELSPSTSEARYKTITGVTGGGVEIPNEVTSTITTNVRIKDGQTLVLGGLFSEKTTITRRQVPYVGDVPVLDLLFNGYDNNVKRQEIIFLVTPTIMKDDMIAKWADEAEGFAESARIGAREGLLPFSREKMSVAQNQLALDALASGDRERALYHVNNSLSINWDQPEMIRLRGELDPAATDAYDRDTLRFLLEKELGSPAPAAPSAARPPARPGTPVANAPSSLED